jgi:hypothetical protein
MWTGALALAATVGLSATLAAPTGGGVAMMAVGLALLAMRHPLAPGPSLIALAVAVGVAVDAGASPSGAPLWGVGLLIASSCAERALALPREGRVEADALVAWLAGLAALAGTGLAAAALVLLAATTDAGTTAIGLAAAALIAVTCSVAARSLARRVPVRERREGAYRAALRRRGSRGWHRWTP